MVLSVMFEELPRVLGAYVRSMIARQAREGFGHEDILAMLIRQGHAGIKDAPAVRRYYFEIMK